MSKAKKQAASEKTSKKELSKLVFEKLSSSLADFHLNEKKLGNRLEKVSRRLASDIVKLLKKETPKSDKTARPKKAAKKKELVAVE
jgi:hypothetical protein